jgi:D-aminoacyl-tRNA deacylase
MRAILQRVHRARVETGGSISGAIQHGLVVFLAVHANDGPGEVEWMVDKILHLRIFDDERGCMSRSLLDVNGELLVVSQFTLYGDCRKGRRPSWHAAAPPDKARQLYEAFITACRLRGMPPQTGVFQASMEVTLTNSGPVTMLVDSPQPL